MVTTVYAVRHAQAKGNLDKVFQGRYDGQLTDLGYEQLDKLAQRCASLGLEAVYSSPLSRAYETAQAVNRHYGYPIHCEDGLLEINGGDWEGQKWASFEQSDPKQNYNWYHAPWDFCAPNGEPMAQVYDRMKETVCRIVSENMGKTIAVVSHGCALCNLITFAKGKPVTQMDRRDICDNTSLTKIVFDEHLIPHLEWENDSSHLDGDLKVSVTELWNHSGSGKE